MKPYVISIVGRDDPGAPSRRALRETFIVIHSYLLPPNSSLE